MGDFALGRSLWGNFALGEAIPSRGRFLSGKGPPGFRRGRAPASDRARLGFGQEYAPISSGKLFPAFVREELPISDGERLPILSVEPGKRSFQPCFACSAAIFSAAVTVFLKSMVMVIGPTPPGTGEM